MLPIFASGFIIFGLITSFFYITKILASLLCTPELFVLDVIVIRLSGKRSIPSGQIE
jgi:hypothetical protein